MANINDLVQKVSKQVDEQAAKGTIIIDGKTYKIKKLLWQDALDLLENITQVVAPSVGSLFDGMGRDEFEEQTTFTEAMLHISNKLNGSTFTNYSLALFEGMTVDGQPFDITKTDADFLGAWRTLFIFAMKENFSSLFAGGWGTKLGEILDKVAPAKTEKQEEI